MKIPESESNIKVGEIYAHSGGTTYRVDGLLWSAEGYEENGSLPKAVIYTQLEDGEIMPAGTRYTRSEINFLKNFVLLKDHPDNISGVG